MCVWCRAKARLWRRAALVLRRCDVNEDTSADQAPVALLSRRSAPASSSFVMHSITRLDSDSGSEVVEYYIIHIVSSTFLDPWLVHHFFLTKRHRRHQRRYTRQDRQRVMYPQGIEPWHGDDGESSSGDVACKCDETEGACGEDGIAVVCAC